MTWLQIKQQAELYRRDPVIYPKRWFNEGKSLLASLYPSACKAHTETYVVTEVRAPMTLPSDCRYVKKVVPADDTTYNYKSFSTDIALFQIAFQTTGTYIVTYLAETLDIAGSDGELPEIHPAYHYPLAKYIAARELEYIRPDWHQQLLAQFAQEADLANKSLKRGTVGVMNIPKRRFR